MKTTIQQSEDKYLITLEGEMDTAAAVEVEKQLQPGLRILISILKGAKAGGSKVVLKDVNDDIKTVFKLTGFINIFDFE